MMGEPMAELVAAVLFGRVDMIRCFLAKLGRKILQYFKRGLQRDGVPQW